MKRTDTRTLISAMYKLAWEVRSGDGVANAAIRESGNRLEELYKGMDANNKAFNREHKKYNDLKKLVKEYMNRHELSIKQSIILCEKLKEAVK